MKAIGIVGSPRLGGNTEVLTRYTLDKIREEGIETELIRLAGLDIRPCNGCMVCRQGERCTINDDVMPVYDRMKETEAIILASPVYFSSCTALLKALIERAGFISGPRRVFAGKAGGALVVARRAGQNFTFAQLMLWFQHQGFYMAGSTYWNIAFGREKGEVTADEEGMRTADNFAKNLAQLMKKLRG